jgi:hypothetical protein
LLESLCQQINYIFQINTYELLLQNKKTLKYEELAEYFQSLLCTYPIILFIDSLDQLNNENSARSDISFLKGNIDIHEDTRIIVSCLPDEYDEMNKTWKYLYLCETKMISSKTRIENE